MINYLPLDEVIAHKGLRLVLVRGMPSPWGQAAKTIFELKKLDVAFGEQDPGGPNEALMAWSGQTSGPVVAWADQAPINRWIDILFLAERLAPRPSLLPADATARALVIGLSNEICGELGIGWNRRLQMFAPALALDSPPEGMARMGAKYRFNQSDLDVAGIRTANSLKALSAQLRTQYARGKKFFVGDHVTALDVYWVAFANFLDPLPVGMCPMPESWRPSFVAQDPVVVAALDPLLLEHRDHIFHAHFRNPMEF